MFDALYISATGMQAQQLNVDTIANNLANVNTTGFKKGKIAFTDLVVQESGRRMAVASQAVPDLLSGGVPSSVGVGIASMTKLFDLGDLKKTDSALDIAIEGDGFLEVLMPDGTSTFTRGGTLKVNQDGLLATQAGYPLKPNLSIPDNVQSMVIEAGGRVKVAVAGQSAVEIGRLELVRFTSPSALQAQGSGLYRASAASGEPIAARPAEDGMGSLAQGFIEGSNVKLTEEMVNLMVAQRVYEANVKAIQAADEMLGMINGLRK